MNFQSRCAIAMWILLFSVCPQQKSHAHTYAITIDDPHVRPSPLMRPAQRNHAILRHLANHKKRAVLYVCGKRVDSKKGRALLQSWSNNGHKLANHTYSHRYFHSKRVSLKYFMQDTQKSHQLIRTLKGFIPLFRFPYLKEGNTAKKRDGFRKYLRENKYQNGYVTIDASDWYYNLRLLKRLRKQPKAKIDDIRTKYLRHMFQRATYYQTLAKKLKKPNIKHTMLLHHNLLNALFLGDLIVFFQKRGWTLVHADDVYRTQPLKSPNILPAGESILWAEAKMKKFKGLRYPAESARYEKKYFQTKRTTHKRNKK